MKKSHVALLTFAITALSADVTADGRQWLRLIPAGEFAAQDGRPGRDYPNLKAWALDEAGASKIIAALKAKQADLVIDYEHQTLHAVTNGQPAPASGWLKDYQWKPDGLYGLVEWTDRAKDMIAAKEYRYFSPVFLFNPTTGAVLRLLHGAITNDPALDESDELTTKAALRACHEEETTVNHAQLCALLGLPETSTADQVQQALTALKARADSVTGKDAEIASLRANAGNPDPARFVPMASLQEAQTALSNSQAEVAALKKKQTDDEIDTLVKKAMADLRISKSLESWARDYGERDLAGLKQYIEKAQPIASKDQQTDDDHQPPENNDLTDPNAVADLAVKYQAEQAALGRTVSTVDAVAHVTRKNSKKGA